MMDLSRRKFLRRAAVVVPAAAIAVPLAIKAVEVSVKDTPPQDDLVVSSRLDLVDVTPNDVEPNLVAEYEETLDPRIDIAVDDPVETCAFALKDRPDDITMWCVKREDGKTYWVINGHWIYNPDDPQWPETTKVWEGVAPFGEREYNAAMNWIRGRIAA